MNIKKQVKKMMEEIKANAKVTHPGHSSAFTGIGYGCRKLIDEEKEYDFSKGRRGVVVPNKIKAEWIEEWFSGANECGCGMRINGIFEMGVLADFLNEKLKVKKEK